MRRPIALTNVGKLDKSSDPLYVRVGDYTDLRGMDFSEEAVMAQTTQAGNERIIDFGAVSLQNQQTRINLPSPYSDDITITLYDINRSVKATTLVSAGGSLSGTKGAIQTFLQSLPYGVSFENTGSTIPYLDVTINFAYADYIIEVTGATTDILQEAISTTGAGKYIPIGSYDLLDDVFYWLTTQRSLPSLLPTITNVYSSVNSQVGITSVNHGLSNFESVSIGSIIGVAGANGIFTITVIDANNFYLNNSFFSGAYVSGGIGYKNIFGYGCIGVVVEDTLQDNFSFIPLLRSKKLNFVTKKQFYTPQIQRSGDLIQMYYTDNFNVPRVTYYRGAYQVDGCIKAFYPSTGEYAYATLGEEITRQVNTGKYSLTIQDQLQSGGNIIAGNCRYAVRFLSESLAPSELSLLTPSIPTFAPGYDSINPATVYGSPSTVTTGKINRMLLDGIKPGVFKYVELIYFQYLGEGQSTATAAFNIRRELLAENQTSIVLEHNGNEPNILFFDAQLANQVQPNIVRSVDNVIIDNRLVDVNITTGTQVDITDWVNTFMYSIKRFPVYGAYGAETNYEFYDPLTTVNHTSYQQYEWYRFYVSGRFKNSGVLSNAFFAFDVRFVSQSDYSSNDEFKFLDTNGYSRRDFTGDELITYDLGDDQRNFYQFGIQFKNIDWSYPINGIPARDIFSEICIFRAERISEVIADGTLIPSYPRTVSPIGSPVESAYVENYGLGSEQFFLPGRDLCAFYSPDLLFSTTTIDFKNGDVVLSFGTQERSQLVQYQIPGTFPLESAVVIYWGVSGSTSPQRLPISDSSFVLPLEQKNIGGLEFTKRFYYNTLSLELFASGAANQSSFVFKFSDFVINNSDQIDDRKYRAIYFRPIKDKYGSTSSQIQILYTGYSIQSDVNSLDVYGGDVFTQQMWLKDRYAIDPDEGSALAYNIISQNRTNANIRLWDSQLTNNQVFPVSTGNYATWLGNLYPNLDQISDNAGYLLRNNVQYQAAYDPQGQDNGEYNSRVIYSELKPNNSNVDYFRVTLPLSFQDTPEIQGAITRALVLNKTLFVLQSRGFTHMYFNSQGTLASADSGQVLIGDGSVLSRIGTNISEFGLQQSGAVVRGRSQSGKDTAMWVNSTFTNVLRFGDDGIRNISLRDNMRIFFNKYLRWAKGADTPADGFGVTGVWDNENSNYIFTVKAWKPYLKFVSGNSYVQGEGVIEGTIEQGVPQIWIALENTSTQPSDSNPLWLKADILNPDYYSCFTFVYSELKNGFTFFPYFLPNFYASWKGRFLTGYSDLESINKSELYLHGEGNPNEFYGVTYDGGQIEMVLNWQPNLNKRVIALSINANVKPIRVDIESLFRDDVNGEVLKKSYLVAADFYTREGYQEAQVKLELDSNGNNDRNTSQMEGVWTKFRLTFPSGVKCKLYDSMVLISDSTRNFTH